LVDGGDLILVDLFTKIASPKKQLVLCASFLNIVVSLDRTRLETKYLSYSKLLPVLEKIVKTTADLTLKAHASVLYLFLYRSSEKYRRGVTIPIDAIFDFISKRSSKKFPSEAYELWYLTLSGKNNVNLALHECIPNTMSNQQVREKLDILSCLNDHVDDEDEFDVIARLSEKLQYTL
jgi:hypothetical protein